MRTFLFIYTVFILGFFFFIVYVWRIVQHMRNSHSFALKCVQFILDIALIIVLRDIFPQYVSDAVKAASLGESIRRVGTSRSNIDKH